MTKFQNEFIYTQFLTPMQLAIFYKQNDVQAFILSNSA